MHWTETDKGAMWEEGILQGNVELQKKMGDQQSLEEASTFGEVPCSHGGGGAGKGREGWERLVPKMMLLSNNTRNIPRSSSAIQTGPPGQQGKKACG